MNYLYFKVGHRDSYVYFNRNFEVFKIVPDTGDPALEYHNHEIEYAQSIIDTYAVKRAKELLLHD